MIKLLIYILALPFYLMYYIFKLMLYSLKVIVLFISIIVKSISISSKSSEKCNLEYINKQYHINENKAEVLGKYKIVKPSELQYSITKDKIEELYKDNGFIVKVIDIRKNKYNTEYEIIFNNEIHQYKILSISEKILEEFNIDGVNIKGLKDKSNRIVLLVPLEYKRVKNTYNA